MAKYKAISFEDIESLAARAAGGDSAALAELGRLNSKYGRTANERMRSLERKGLETGAYRRAVEELGRPRFSQAKTGDAETLLRSLEMVTKFLNYQTSTISGELERRSNILEGMERAGYNVGSDRAAFLRFLESDAWNEIRGMFGSKDAMQRVSDAMERGGNIDDLVNSYNDFQKGESDAEDILQVWDGWVEEI